MEMLLNLANAYLERIHRQLEMLLKLANAYLKSIHRQLVISNALRIVELKRDDLTDEQYDKIINYELDYLKKEMDI